MEDIARALRRGDIAALDEAFAILPEFVEDPEMMIAAVAQGPPEATAWMIARGAPVSIPADDGFPLMYLAVDRARDPGAAPDPEARVLRMLIAAGGDLQERGLNDWTPLHVAAVIGDLRACRILLEAGADLGARTRIDDCATPEEEARIAGAREAADLLEGWPRKS